MWKFARSVLAIVVGMALSMAGIRLIDRVNHSTFPPPPAVVAAQKTGDMQAMAAAISDWLPDAPLGALVFLPTGWIVATLVGSLVAALIAGRAPLIHALIVGLLPLTGTIVVLCMIPHPLWMAIAGLAGVPLAALAAGLLVQRARPAGPRPYDMREKNMAC